MQYIVRFPTAYFPLPENGLPAGLASVYIGIVDEDPLDEAYRIDVDVLQEDGTIVTIPPASQPFVLSAGGVFTYQGSTVQLAVNERYSMAIVPVVGAEMYFPSGTPPLGEAVELPALPGDPATIEDSGFLYTKLVSDVPQLFYEDDEGNVVQITNADGVNAPTSTLDVTGVRMPFFMSVPPLGWTKITTHTDAMMRVVNTAGGTFGGTDSPIAFTQDMAHIHSTGSLALTTAQMPAHTHVVNMDNKDNSATNTGGQRVGDSGNAAFGIDVTSSSTGSGDAHNHGNTGSAGGTVTFSPKYVDFIIAEKQ